MTNTLKITSTEQFTQLVIENDPHICKIVYFIAYWAGPCRYISPCFDQLSEVNINIRFYIVDVDERDEIAEQFEVRAIPSFLMYREGEVVDRFVGGDPIALQRLVQRWV